MNRFFYFLTLITFIYSQQGKFLYKCDYDSHQMPIQSIKAEPFDKNNPQYKRRLNNVDKDGFKNMNMYVDLTNIKEEIKELKLTRYESIFINSIQKAVNTLNSLLKIKYCEVDFNVKDNVLEGLGIKYWDKEKFGTKKANNGVTFTKLGIDILILARFENLGQTTLANAVCQYIIGDIGQPLVGLVNIIKQLIIPLKIWKNICNLFSFMNLHMF